MHAFPNPFSAPDSPDSDKTTLLEKYSPFSRILLMNQSQTRPIRTVFVITHTPARRLHGNPNNKGETRRSTKWAEIRGRRATGAIKWMGTGTFEDVGS